MATPVLVRTYKNSANPSSTIGGGRSSTAQALPPISSYAFADILRSADCPEFQQAIDGIAEICAKNRMSLADEYASHLPPLGEITADTSANVRPHMLRPGMRRALTSVPEGNSGSSEGSSKMKRTSPLLSLGRTRLEPSKPLRRVRINHVGGTITVSTTTSLAASPEFTAEPRSAARTNGDLEVSSGALPSQRTPSEAVIALQRLLNDSRSTQA